MLDYPSFNECYYDYRVACKPYYAGEEIIVEPY